jgi:hypothetical protein
MLTGLLEIVAHSAGDGQRCSRAAEYRRDTCRPASDAAVPQAATDPFQPVATVRFSAHQLLAQFNVCTVSRRPPAHSALVGNSCRQVLTSVPKLTKYCKHPESSQMW